MKYLYLVTIKRNCFDYTSRQTLYTRLRNLIEDAPSLLFINEKYELDKHKRWHLHTLANCNKRPYYKRFQRKGYTTHFKEILIEDYRNALKYINKDNYKRKDQLDVESYAHYNYMFRKT